MKKYINFLTLLSFVSLFWTSCSSEDITYSDKEYVMFSDSLEIFPVTNVADSTLHITVGSTVTRDYDRSFAVEVINKKSTAVEGVHYKLMNNNIIIKAGERTSTVQMQGLYDGINREDSLVVTLKLVAPAAKKWDIYGDEIRVDLIKIFPFDINDMEGNIRLHATFPFAEELVRLPKMLEVTDEKTAIIKDMFSRNVDLKIRFEMDNVHNQHVVVPAQLAFRDPGYGNVYVSSVEQMPSFVIMPEKIIALQLDMYVPNMGSFGVFQYILEWITPEQAEGDKNDIVIPFAVNNYVSTFKLK